MSLGPKVSAPLQTILTFGRFINRKIIYVRYNVLLDGGNVITLLRRRKKNVQEQFDPTLRFQISFWKRYDDTGEPKNSENSEAVVN